VGVEDGARLLVKTGFPPGSRFFEKVEGSYGLNTGFDYTESTERILLSQNGRYCECFVVVF